MARSDDRDIRMMIVMAQCKGERPWSAGAGFLGCWGG